MCCKHTIFGKYDDKLWVSIDGDLYNPKTESFYTLCDINGYKYINRGYAHRFVGMVFIPNPYNKPQINHKNLNRSDNRVENLEWVTPHENQLHSYKFNKKRPTVGREFILKGAKASAEKRKQEKKYKMENEKGKIYGEWKIIDYLGNDKVLVKCLSCKKEFSRYYHSIISGDSPRCVHCAGKKKSKSIEELDFPVKVLREVDKSPSGVRRVEYICTQCGTPTVGILSAVKNGKYSICRSCARHNQIRK